jgi:hypothetical protein
MPTRKCVEPLEAPPSVNGRVDKNGHLASTARRKRTRVEIDLCRAAGNALSSIEMSGHKHCAQRSCQRRKESKSHRVEANNLIQFIGPAQYFCYIDRFLMQDVIGACVNKFVTSKHRRFSHSQKMTRWPCSWTKQQYDPTFQLLT